MRGIDVSHWQGAIDWPKVKDAGYEFAYMKATEGTGYVDPRFAQNWVDAKKAGVKVGAYLFYRPLGGYQAQADSYHKTVGALRPGIDLIPMVDVEFVLTDKGVDLAAATQNLAMLVVTLEQLYGKPIGIYTSVGAWDSLPHANRFGHLPLWVAVWTHTTDPLPRTSLPEGWASYAIHQYSSDGTVPGITGRVDLNYASTLQGLLVAPPEQDAKIALRAALDSAQATLATARALIDTL